MVRRLCLMMLLCFAAMLSGSASLAQSRPAQRIIAVGDLHGDFSAWSDVARAAGLVSAKGGWAGGNTIFVQLGDVPDRGPDSLKIIRQLMRLQREAPRKGGRVIALVGNHEAMNMTRDLRYVDPGEYAAFTDRKSAARRDKVFADNRASIVAQYRAADPKLSDAAARELWLKDKPLGWVEHELAWRPTGEIGRWVIRNPAVALVSGNLFVHGGIGTEYAKLPLAEINRQVAAALTSRDESETAIINNPLGPLWYRGLVERAPGDIRPPMEQELSATLTVYGAKRIVVAHTPLLSGIAILHGGTLVRVDSCLSRHYGGQVSYLEIIGDQLIPHAVPRSGG